MIKFFRNIRYKMMGQSRVGKYLLYAVGEIILVVIGILIALQINNWNEDKIERKAENEYMQNLLEDLKTDLLLYDNYKENNREIFSLIDSLIASLDLESRNAKGNLSIYHARIMTTKWNRVRPVERTFEQMKSSGQLKIIQQQEISDGIAEYYTTIYKLDTYNDAALIWLESFLGAMGKVFKGPLLFEILKTRQPIEVQQDVFVSNNPVAINELISWAQYVYGAIELSEGIIDQRRKAADKLIGQIETAYKNESSK